MKSEQIINLWLSKMLGRSGGLFALGMLCGAALMHFYLGTQVIEKLEQRIEKVEADNARLNEEIKRIAFERL